MLLYALQIASSNLRHTSFDQPVKTRIVIDPSRVHETELHGDPWDLEDLYDEEDEEEEERQQQEEEKDKGSRQKDEDEDEEALDAEVEELQAAMQRKPACKNQPSAEAIRSHIRRTLIAMLPAIPNRPPETAGACSAKPPAEVVPPALPACREIPPPALATPQKRQTTSKSLLHLAEAAGIGAPNPPEKPLAANDFFSLPLSRTGGSGFREGS
jgi:hypothetical protein